MTRIAVVGNGGSGKTWLALRLSDVLHVPAIHLDLYRYDSAGAIRSDEVFRLEVRDRLTETPEWVADGNSLTTLEERLALADVVIFLDLPDLVCVGGVLTRQLRHSGRRLEDATHVDRFNRGFVRYLLNYRRDMRPRVLASLASFTCPVVQVRTRRQARAFARGSRRELRRVAALLRTETVGGFLLVGAAVVALVWANSLLAPSYSAVRDTAFGPESLHLHLTVGQWASDGLLAVFFFLIGLELKHEFVAGDLRSPATAIVPVAAAAGGVLAPVLVYLVLNAGGHGVRGWAVPAATDIAFALAVLAIISSHLPAALRTFLLTLAVVDDLIAIIIIAVAYTASIHVVPLVLALIPIGAFAFLVQRWPTFFSTRRWSLVVILLPIAAVAWALVHASGIHATIAGVALGMCVPVLRTRQEDSNQPQLADTLDHLIRPVSAGFVVPVFALFSAGVTIGSLSGLGASLRDPVTLGIICGLVLGKPIGIVATSFLVTRFRRISLDESIGWPDIMGVGVLAGIGFTVSLLVAELSFPSNHPAHDDAKLGVLVASLIASLLAAVVLGLRNRRYRAWEEADTSEDEDDD